MGQQCKITLIFLLNISHYGLNMAFQQLGYSKEITPLLFIKMLVDPALMIVCLIGVVGYFGEAFEPKYYVTVMIIFALTFPGKWSIAKTVLQDLGYVFNSWLFNTTILLLFGYATGYLEVFPRKVILSWLWITPLCMLIFHISIDKLSSSIGFTSFVMRNAVIVGVNDLGLQLRDKMISEVELGLKFRGFFDDRELERLKIASEKKDELLGNFSKLSEYVKNNAIDMIYIALPMTSEPRVLDLLDDLKDTTTSIYFVPDVFIFDLIQARIDDVAGIPVIAVCETPFSGIMGLAKRVSDVLFSVMILILVLPVMLMIAALIKATSKGPVLFKQRRYGLDGQQIIVYKFRSMAVSEDGSLVTQATKDDARVTSIGKFIRKTSLDELPQFVNVIQGRMSVVGPRPHAVAHNETYRKVIKGYMIRHKVRPGITGWAQVNGFRGETETIDKMKTRIDYDLDYLRQWSLMLDIKIIFKTILLVLLDRKAY